MEDVHEADGYDWTVPDEQKPILSLDFDGVLNSYKSGFGDGDEINDPPTPGALEFLREAVEHFHVHLHSTRLARPKGKMAIASWMTRHFGLELAHRVVYSESKPPARVHLDDRCLTFVGRWPSMAELHNFQPWYRKGFVPQEVYRAVWTLNQALWADREAIEALVGHRVVCNEKLAEHESIQVGRLAQSEREFTLRAERGLKQYEVGLLGIINGLFGTMADGYGWIAAEYDEAGHIKAFRVTPPREEREREK